MWHSFKIVTSSESLANLGIEAEIEETIMRIDINSVVAYYASHDRDDVPVTSLWLLGGHTIDVYEKFEIVAKIIEK